jgi:hypothetical protein
LEVGQCARKEKETDKEMEIDPPQTDKGGRNKKQRPIHNKFIKINLFYSKTVCARNLLREWHM